MILSKKIPVAGPITRQVFLVVHNPTIRAAGGRPLSQLLGWNDPGALVQTFVEEMALCSHGVARFQVVERLDLDEFPVKADGFQYTEKSFVEAWQARRGFHHPDLVDYPHLLGQVGAQEKVADGKVDEIWLMAFPYAGYYESRMAGPGAYWCNSPPLDGYEASGRRFVVMGFNYERGVGEMMESFGHRAESILDHVFAPLRGEANLWARFTRHEKTHPSRAEVGNIHFAPNSERDYDWGNPRPVLSRCDTWLDFPYLEGSAREVTCADWGGGDIRRHHRWWFHHIPHVEGRTDGIAHNWWAYILDPDKS